MKDPVDIVALDRIDRSEATSEGLVIHFRSRPKFGRVLGFGSWGVVLLVPMMAFALEAPTLRAKVFCIGLAAFGACFVYAALHAWTRSPRLILESYKLRLEQNTWRPRGAVTFDLHALSSVEATPRAVTFWEPASYRGFTYARAWTVALETDRGRRFLELYCLPDHARRLAEAIAQTRSGRGLASI